MLAWMWVVWLLAGLALVALEVHSQAFYALFLALGAFVATIVALFPTEVWLQAVIAAVVAAAGTMLVRPTLARVSARHLGPTLSLPGASDSLVGQQALTVDAVGDENHPGHARLAGERYLAMTVDAGRLLEPQTPVTVVAVRGTTLVVAPLQGS